MKIHLVEVNLFHADRQTYMTKLIAAFCNFAKHIKRKEEKYDRK